MERIARELETRKIAMVIERIEEAVGQATRFLKNLVTTPQKRAEQIRELRIRELREKGGTSKGRILTLDSKTVS